MIDSERPETVVSNTTPISQLAKIGRLELLRELFGTILIPQEVYDELTEGDHPAATLVPSASWIEVRPADSVKVDSMVRTTRLDPGECAVFVLAEEIGADRVLIDDGKARIAATARGLSVTGTVGALIRAKERRLISSVKQILDELRMCDTYISDWLYAEAVAAAEE